MPQLGAVCAVLSAKLEGGAVHGHPSRLRPIAAGTAILHQRGAGRGAVGLAKFRHVGRFFLRDVHDVPCSRRRAPEDGHDALHCVKSLTSEAARSVRASRCSIAVFRRIP